MTTENTQVVIDEPTPVNLARDICAMNDNEDFETFAEFVRGMAPYIITPLARAVLAVAELAAAFDAEGNSLMANGDRPHAYSAYAHAARLRTVLNGDNA